MVLDCLNLLRVGDRLLPYTPHNTCFYKSACMNLNYSRRAEIGANTKTQGKQDIFLIEPTLITMMLAADCRSTAAVQGTAPGCMKKK